MRKLRLGHIDPYLGLDPICHFAAPISLQNSRWRTSLAVFQHLQDFQSFLTIGATDEEVWWLGT